MLTLINFTPLIITIGGGYFLANTLKDQIMDNIKWVLLGMGGIFLLSTLLGGGPLSILYTLFSGLLIGAGLFFLFKDGSSE